MATIIKGGTVVSAQGRFRGDVLIEKGRIAAVGSGLHADTVMDASDCYVLPGGIDPHTHIEMPAGAGGTNADTWYSGTRAAAFGGTTTIIDMITQEHGSLLSAAVTEWRRRSDTQALVDYGFHMGITDPTAAVLAEIPDMVQTGIPSFKLYLAYRTRMVSDAQAFLVMQAVARQDGMVLVHAENGPVIDALVAEALWRGETGPPAHAASRPAAAEAEATARACRLAELTGVRLYVVHVTCDEALTEIRHARSRGQTVLAETCLHYLLFAASQLDLPDFEGARWVMTPPLRADADRHALWQALSSQTINALASDHCPWTLAQKNQGRDRFDRIPGGVPGVEERIPFLYTYGVEAGRLSMEQLVALTSTNPARIFGLYPAKGIISPGSDADLVVWDPAPSRLWGVHTHHSAADHTPYANMPVHGAVRHLLVRGQPIICNETLVGEAGFGQFIARR